MALATTCPQCKTSFRVVPDQLKLRRGFVRCGRCRHVFAGIDHLRYVDDAQLRAEARAAGDEAQCAAEEAAEAEPKRAAAADDFPSAGFDPADFPSGVDSAYLDARDHEAAGDDAEWIVVGAPASDHPLFAGPFDDDAPVAQTEQREEPAPEAPAKEPVPADTLPGDASVEEAVVAESSAGEADLGETRNADARAADEAHVPEAHVPEAHVPEAHVPEAYVPEAHLPEARRAEAAPDDRPPPYVERYADSAYDTRDDDESAIDYFSTARTRGFADRRGLAAGLLALALAVALAMQWVVAQRSAIATQLPFAAPLLAAALAPFGLRIEAPDELEALTIESFELQASAVPDVLEMRALLRNRADHPVRWPSMQLTLTDPSSRVLVRRALHPDDYLPPADEARDAGVPAGTEWPLRLALEARDLQAAGYDYRVQLFYPQERR